MINFSFLSTKKKLGQEGKKSTKNGSSQKERVADQVRKVLGSSDQELIVMVRN